MSEEKPEWYWFSVPWPKLGKKGLLLSKILLSNEGGRLLIAIQQNEKKLILTRLTSYVQLGVFWSCNLPPSKMVITLCWKKVFLNWKKNQRFNYISALFKTFLLFNRYNVIHQNCILFQVTKKLFHHNHFLIKYQL